MPQYELLALFPGNDPEGIIAAQKEEIAKALVETGGNVVRTYAPQKERLAYPINGTHTGTYLRCVIAMAQEKLPEFERKLHLIRGLNRHLMTHYTPASVGIGLPVFHTPAPVSAPVDAQKLSKEEIEKRVEEALAAEEQT